MILCIVICSGWGQGSTITTILFCYSKRGIFLPLTMTRSIAVWVVKSSNYHEVYQTNRLTLTLWLQLSISVA